jgi:RNA polymerase sigma-70 factor (ECF subfamily)
MIEDRLLLWRFKRGDGDALRRIYEKYRTDLLRLAISLTGDSCTAEDVVQDVFAAFAQSGDRLRVDGHLKGYLAVSVMNGVRNVSRATRSSRRVSLDAIEAQVANAATPAQWVTYSEQMQRAAKAMIRLPTEQREVIVLHVYGKMTFRAIAEYRKISVNTVLSRYRYGIDRLRSILYGELEE